MDYIALVLIVFSFLVFGYSLTKTKKETLKIKSEPKSPESGLRKRSKAAKPSDIESFRMEEEDASAPAESFEERDFERKSMPSVATESAGPEKKEMLSVRPETMGGSADVVARQSLIERKASLIYWERMSLEEEYELFVTLHRPEFKVSSPEGATIHESERTYKLPTTGHVRIIPVCSGCNISPAYRDMKVSELDDETRAEFKVLPVKDGEYDLNVEFQVVNADGTLIPLGTETTKVTVQKKPIELDLKFMNLSVSRRVPAFFSMCGSLFGLTSFVLARLGINLNEEIVAWSLTISTGVAGAIILLLALLLLFKGLKPLMNEIDITFG
ncbi:MAG: hypothetical protein KAQ65_03795 [Candidatus Thorarchaeota archaeon]|nr:hypothetical protein [Candidatus Thorarchaeota archaeon]